MLEDGRAVPLVARMTVHDLLAETRDGADRLTPLQAFGAVEDGAVLIDSRSSDEQRRQGVLIPGALHHPLSVLLWRLDPDCPTRNAKLPLEAQIVVICREGYSSSLAAALLRRIGFARATDVVGGVDAWRAARLPVTPFLGVA